MSDLELDIQDLACQSLKWKIKHGPFQTVGRVLAAELGAKKSLIIIINIISIICALS